MRIEEFDDLDEVRRLAAMARSDHGLFYRWLVRVASSALVLLIVATFLIIIYAVAGGFFSSPDCGCSRPLGIP